MTELASFPSYVGGDCMGEGLPSGNEDRVVVLGVDIAGLQKKDGLHL